VTFVIAEPPQNADTVDVSIVFGPVQSRRFGRSLGINHLPRKECSYSCVYCQLGPTLGTSVERRAFCETETIVAEVRAVRKPYDVISFVPDGEPTLDLNLGAHIAAVKQFGAPVAVITNGSLLWMESVRRDLDLADIVSIEIDAVDEAIWRRIDRPSPALSFHLVLDGIRALARERRGKLWTQTMLVRGERGDRFDDLENVAAFIGEITPDRICISVPTRPPADPAIRAADGVRLARALELLPTAELMTHDPGTACVQSTDELLAVLAVHPLREETVEPDLIDERRIRRIAHAGEMFLTLR
jgi:wyosine [tRNA(Phe)-imidazoG37] synthetase (radical SAM superfamily)